MNDDDQEFERRARELGCAILMLIMFAIVVLAAFAFVIYSIVASIGGAA